jgi:hypothetical protein
MIFLIPGALGSSQGGPNWSTHNLFVEFDENGIVSRAREIKEKNVIRELVAWSRGSASQPVNFSALSQEVFAASTFRQRTRRNGLMSVRSDSLEFFDQHSRTTFKVANGDVGSFKIVPRSGAQVTYNLKFKKSTPWGKELDVYIDPPYLLTLLRHLGLTQP